MFSRISKTISLLSIFAAVLSALTLLRTAANFGFSPTLAILLDYYALIVETVFAWSRPMVLKLSEYLSARLGVTLIIYDDWRHLFLVLWIYFGADVRANLTLGRRSFSFFTWVWGGMIALVTSILTSIGSVDAEVTELKFVAGCVAGIVIFEIGRALWSMGFRRSYAASKNFSRKSAEIFRYHLLHFVAPIIVLGAAAIATTITVDRDFLTPITGAAGIINVLGLITALALFWIGRGAIMAVPRGANQSSSWFSRFCESGAAQHGFAILSVILGVLIFLLTNSGLNTLGL